MRRNRKWLKKNKDLINTLLSVTGLIVGITSFIYSRSIDKAQVLLQEAQLKIQQDQFDLTRQPRFNILSYKEWPEDRGIKDDNVYFVIKIVNRGYPVSADKIKFELYTFLHIDRFKHKEFSEELIPLSPRDLETKLQDTTTLALIRTIDIEEFDDQFEVNEILSSRSDNSDVYVPHGMYVLKIAYTNYQNEEKMIFHTYDYQEDLFREVPIEEGMSREKYWKESNHLNLMEISDKEFADLLFGK